MITRPGADSFARNGALDADVLIKINGRFNGFSHSARSAAETSSPRRLNFDSRPSYVPWPRNTIQSSLEEVFASRSMACFSFVRLLVSANPRPMVTACAPACLHASCQRCADLANTSAYFASPSAPTRSEEHTSEL